MLRIAADLEMVNHLELGGIDHIDIARFHIRDIDARERAGRRRTELSRPRFAVEIARIDHGRHAGDGLDRSTRRGLGRSGRQTQKHQSGTERRTIKTHCDSPL